jgi:acyl-CoA thioesterase I
LNLLRDRVYLGTLGAIICSLHLQHADAEGNMSDSRPAKRTGQSEIRYVAVGDSYSNGEGARPEQSWPALLARHLSSEGIKIALVANPSVTGWTTQQAMERELPLFRQARPDFATLLIGVNDWVQGVSAETFRRNLGYLLEQMLSVLPVKGRLLLVTIPDFSVTPEGPKYARGRNISEGISSFNNIIIEEARKRNLQVADIFPASQRMRDHPALVAADGLHPSAKTYAEWEQVIYPLARDLLKR